MEVFDSTLSNLAVKYSNFLGLKITDSSIKKDIEGHPNYPSLLSLSDTFTKYQVTNNAFVIDKSELEDFITPFIAYVTLPKVSADFVLVTEINNAFCLNPLKTGQKFDIG